MTAGAYLFVWSLVGVTFSSGGPTYTRYYEWKNVAEFKSVAACQDAANQLGIQSTLFRCVKK